MSVPQPQSPARVVFGPFEVNTSTGELLKGGIRVRLSGQPFEILLLLLAHPGDLVTREHLREQIWREGTFVDFEHGLNAAINKLRRALGDSAEKPRYIETVPGRGYRFLGAVERRLSVPALIDHSRLPQPVAAGRSVAHRGIVAPFWAWVALAALMATFGIWGLVTLLTTQPDSTARTVLQFTIAPPAGTIFAPPISRQPFAVSPDGARLAFTATGANGTSVWIRDFATLDMQPVRGTEGAWVVFWSPDSRSIFSSVKRSLKQANLETGSTRSVANLPFITMFGAWRSPGDLLLYLGPHHYYELLLENGALRELPNADMRWAQFLPPGNRFLHVVFNPELGRYRAVVTDYLTGHSTPLMETDSRVQYAPPLHRGEIGHLFFIRGSSLVMQPFDSDRQRLVGEAIPIVQNVIHFRPSASACFSVSQNGVLVYQTDFPVSELNWYDRAGRVVGTVGRSAPYAGPVRISPDGRRVAAAVWSPDNGGLDIWTYEANGRESRRLTYPPAVHGRPVWSPDGARVASSTSKTGAPHLATLETAQAANEQAVLKDSSRTQQSTDQIQLPTDWSRDGRYIAFDTGLGEEEQQVWLADVARHNAIPFLHDEFAQWGAAFSSDSTRLAFVSAESGRPEVYVQRFDATSSPRLVRERRQVSRDGAWIVRWRPDGRELFYLGMDNWLYAVPANGPLQFGEPERLFRIAGTPQYGTTSDFQFDVARDGQRFIMTNTGSVAPPAFTVIENWPGKFHY